MGRRLRGRSSSVVVLLVGSCWDGRLEGGYAYLSSSADKDGVDGESR